MKQSIINIVVAVVTVILTIGQLLGYSLGWLDPDVAGLLAGALYTIIATAWLVWKNTNLTGAAKTAQVVTKGIKGGFDKLNTQERIALRSLYTDMHSHLQKEDNDGARRKRK
jgi:hypothetical protein